MNKPVKIALIGAGHRGLLSYATYAETHPEQVQIVAVAEPREWFRNEAIRRHNIPQENVFTDWVDLLSKPKLADAVIIATQDKFHCEPAVACARKGYDILLEKPMATTPEECQKIYDEVTKAKVILGVCHVLRYTAYFKKLREIVASGILGQITSLRHLEQIGYWHFAHSYVRGNWRNLQESSPMILAKSCHDFDIISFILGERRCQKISSFGALQHFKAENKPAGASDRCLDCKFIDSCDYSAAKIYGERLKNKDFGWPLDVVTQDFSETGLNNALRNGPYGRCVYASDNDVADNQTVSMVFEDNITVNFTAVACTKAGDRITEIWGSAGDLYGDSKKIELRLFKDKEPQIFKFDAGDDSVSGGHMGGDHQLMDDFCKAVATRDISYLSSGPDSALAAHLLAFYAEEAREEGSVINI